MPQFGAEFPARREVGQGSALSLFYGSKASKNFSESGKEPPREDPRGGYPAKNFPL